MRPASSCSSLYVILRATLLVVILLLLGTVLVTGAPTWAAPVLTPANQTVPPFAERLILPLIHNQTQPINLTRSLAFGDQPTWSPDGSKVAFVRSRAISDNHYENNLYIINVDGSGLTQLTDEDDAPPRLSPESGDWHVGLPAWSPDGSEIAFIYTACARCEGHGIWRDRLYVVGVDGTNLREISTFDANNPKWSPDGSKILLESLHDYTTPAGVLFTVSPLGGLHMFLGVQGTYSAWSPDGTKVAFVCVSCEMGSDQIAVIDADGTNLRVLSTGGPYNNFPAWSPDSKQIAYAAYQGDRPELRVIDATGENPTTLGAIQWQSLWSLTWLPDGDRLAFIGQDSTSQQRSLYVIGRDGQDLRRMFTLPSNVDINDPQWSPDRSKLAFEYNDDIYILQVFGQ